MNVEEKVATLEALLVRVKSNAAKPRPVRRTDDVAGVVAHAPIAEAPLAEAPKAAPPPIAAPVTPPARPVAAVESPKDPWDALVEATSEAVPTVPAKPAEKPAEKPAVAQKPVEAKPVADDKPIAAEKKPLEETPAVAATGTTPKAPPVIPATPKAPARTPLPAAKPGLRPEAPKMGEKGEKIELTTSASLLPKVEATAPKITATGSALPKIAPEKSTGSALPKVTPEKVTGSALPKITADKVTGSALPKVTPEKVTGSALPKITPAAPPKAAQDKSAVPPPPATASLKEEAAAAAAALKAEMAAAAAASKAEAERARAALPKIGSEDEQTADDDTRLMSVQPLVEAERALVSEELTADEETKLILPHLRPETGAAAAKSGLKLEPKIAGKPREEEGEAPRIEAHAIESIGDEADTSADAGEKDETDVDIGADVAAEAQAKVAEHKPEGEDGEETQLMEPRRSQPDTTPRPMDAEVAPPLPAFGEVGADGRPQIPRLEPSEQTSPSRRIELPSLPPEAPPPRRVPQWTLAFTAAALVGAGVFVGLRSGWFESLIGGAPTTTPSASVAPRASVAPVVTQPPPPVSALPVESAAAPPVSASAAVSGAPAESASAPAASASQAPTAPPASASAAAPPAVDGDGTNLAADRGYLTITGVPASVYLGGVFVGLTNTKIQTTCGPKYVRLGAPPPAGADKPAAPQWISEGKSVIVACRAVTTQAM